jgi:glycerol-3-phosphate acyltransferase PlsX
MSKPITISLDAMGGDFGPSVVVPAALLYLEKNKNVSLILVGREKDIKVHLGQSRNIDRITIVHASETVAMDELPSKALRSKKDSSMRVALNLVKEGRANACVSAGNTGALMATSRFVLKMLPHIDRPAIITALPTSQGHTHVLDLGANVDCSAEHLFQFAVMSSELVSSVENKKSPTVGLLNIGQEEIKGNEQVKRAHDLLVKSSLNYVGYVEGDDIYKGSVDVVVCDGFVGNVALKCSEGVAKMIGQFLKDGFNRNIFTKLAALLALPVLKRLKSTIDPGNYNGATFIGLRGVVVKSHGGADIMAFCNAIGIAQDEAKLDVPSRIARQIESHLGGSEEEVA